MEICLQDLAKADLKRIAVIGCPGSGKTTLARKIGKALGRKVVHLDKELWLPDWTEMPFEQREAIHEAIIMQEEWIIDGMWRSHVQNRLKRATLVVFLDFNTDLCLKRIFKRRENGDVQRDDIAEGCLESKDNDFDGFVRYVKSFNDEVRPVVADYLANTNVDCIRLTHAYQTRVLVNALKNY